MASPVLVSSALALGVPGIAWQLTIRVGELGSVGVGSEARNAPGQMVIWIPVFPGTLSVLVKRRLPHAHLQRICFQVACVKLNSAGVNLQAYVIIRLHIVISWLGHLTIISYIQRLTY